jgi:phosphatidylglycerol:prolipoprotein diacylglycerol transferase
VQGVSVVAGIPYETFPTIQLGPLTIRVFGLMVALGMVLGILVAARRNERFGVPRGETERVGFWLVVIGLVGARLTWVLSHLELIRSPLDVIAVWEGGLQFTGGFVAAAVAAPLLTRSWPGHRRWVFLDGAVLGLAIGQLIGRIGCYAVGEHLGGSTGFFLGVTYRGGPTIEGPLQVGVTYHNAALYEILWLVPIIAALLWLDRRGARAGLMTAVFAISYGTFRFLTDFVRAYDQTLLGLTGAQYGSILLVAVGIWLLLRVRRAGPPDPADRPADQADSPPAPA